MTQFKGLCIVALGGTMLCGAQFALSTSPVEAAPKVYGCYRVINASSIAIRKSPWLWAPIIGYASKGTKLVKRRRFCSVRPWCPVRKGGVNGWSGKRYLKKVKC